MAKSKKKINGEEKIYRVKHREVLYTEFFIHVKPGEDPDEVYRSLVENGDVDFSDIEQVDGEDAFEEIAPEKVRDEDYFLN